MCDFKVGDEVVCVDIGPGSNGVRLRSDLVIGSVYSVSGIWSDPRSRSGVVVSVEGVDCTTISGGFAADRFRKVQRRDLTEWLSSSVGNTDKIDKRKRVNA